MKKFLSLVMTLTVLLATLSGIAVASDASVGVSEGFYLKAVPSESDETVLVYDLCVKDVAGHGVSSFGIELDYSEHLELVSCDAVYSKGSFITSEHMDARPYLIMWVAGTFSLGAEETVIARIVFNVVGNIEDGFELGFEFDPENMPASIDGTYFEEDDIPAMGVVEFTYEEIVEQFPFFVTIPGDVNGDEKINITDVSFILKHIAKWDVEINLDAANVNGDEKVSLGDVSLLLKYIAKWDVTLG